MAGYLIVVLLIVGIVCYLIVKGKEDNADNHIMKKSIEYHVDIVFCINASKSMQTVLETIKHRALSLCDDIKREMDKHGKQVQQLRARVIVFRDYLADGNEAMLESDFFHLPDKAADFQTCLRSIEAKGGENGANSGLEALAYAIRSKWDMQSIHRRQIIFIWSDKKTHELGCGKQSGNYPKGMAKDFNELTSWWGTLANPSYMDQAGKRLVLFTPNEAGWNLILDNWDCSIQCNPPTEKELTSDEYDALLSYIWNAGGMTNATKQMTAETPTPEKSAVYDPQTKSADFEDPQSQFLSQEEKSDEVQAKELQERANRLTTETAGKAAAAKVAERSRNTPPAEENPRGPALENQSDSKDATQAQTGLSKQPDTQSSKQSQAELQKREMEKLKELGKAIDSANQGCGRRKEVPSGRPATPKEYTIEKPGFHGFWIESENAVIEQVQEMASVVAVFQNAGFFAGKTRVYGGVDEVSHTGDKSFTREYTTFAACAEHLAADYASETLYQRETTGGWVFTLNYEDMSVDLSRNGELIVITYGRGTYLFKVSTGIPDQEMERIYNQVKLRLNP